MMKTKDVSVATSLILQGFLRANGDESKTALAEAIAAIRQEADDWSENIERHDDGSALEPQHIATGGLLEMIPMTTLAAAPIKRTPYNLVSAAIALLHEAVDLNGPEDVVSDLRRRCELPLGVPAPRPLGEILGADEVVGSIPAK